MCIRCVPGHERAQLLWYGVSTTTCLWNLSQKTASVYVCVPVSKQMKAGATLPSWVVSNLQTFWKQWVALLQVSTQRRLKARCRRARLVFVCARLPLRMCAHHTVYCAHHTIVWFWPGAHKQHSRGGTYTHHIHTPYVFGLEGGQDLRGRATCVTQAPETVTMPLDVCVEVCVGGGVSLCVRGCLYVRVCAYVRRGTRTWKIQFWSLDA